MEREFKRRTGLRKLFNPPCSSQVFDASFGVSAAIGYLRGCSYTRARAHSHTRGSTRKETSSIEILSNQKTAPPSRQNKYRAIFAMHSYHLSLSLHPRFSLPTTTDPPFLRVFLCDEMHACNTWSPCPNQTFQVFTIKAEFGVRACASRMNLAFEETTMLYTPPGVFVFPIRDLLSPVRGAVSAEFLSPLFQLFRVDFWIYIYIYIFFSAFKLSRRLF